MVVGCLCYAASLGVFLISNEIVGGGVSGAASLIQILTEWPAGIFIELINGLEVYSKVFYNYNRIRSLHGTLGLFGRTNDVKSIDKKPFTCRALRRSFARSRNRTIYQI